MPATSPPEAERPHLPSGGPPAAGIVALTEGLYQVLFTGAVAYGLASALWGLVIAPFNAYDHHLPRSVVVGVLLTLAWLPLLRRHHRQGLFFALRRQPGWLALPVLVGLAVLWADGGWRSSYFLASYAAIPLAAAATNLRTSLFCGAALAVGYLGGLGINGYTPAKLEALKDADSVVANAGGYLLAGVFLALPVGHLGGYVARVNQIISVPPRPSVPPRQKPRARERTGRLTPREVEVAILVAAGATNAEIAQQLVVSVRTAQSHVESAKRKSEAKNRAELAALAIREGLVDDPGPPPG